MKFGNKTWASETGKCAQLALTISPNGSVILAIKEATAGLQSRHVTPTYYSEVKVTTDTHAAASPHFSTIPEGVLGADG
jgi:formylmethanofuran dehydrogenase subunit D